MSYDAIKAGVRGVLEGLALAPSDQLVDFEIASPNEFGNTYILYPQKGDLEGVEKESLADRVYDTQTWLIQVAYDKGIHSEAVNIDELCRKREEIIQAVDNPTNWTSFARMLNVIGWELENFEHYIVLIIKVEITDTITY